MNKKNLEILGLSQDATAEEITAAYNKLREKYLEERFLDGEAGNNAAKMLTKIDVAYQELMAELNEAPAGEGGASFAQVEEEIRKGNYQEAQKLLDNFNERPAQWHYLQSVVFYRKQWMNESKKQLEIAIQLEPDNQKYRETYRKLMQNINSPQGSPEGGQRAGDGYQSQYQGQNMNYPQDDQMGEGCCASCLNFCYTYLCLSCLCNSCCR